MTPDCAIPHRIGNKPALAEAALTGVVINVCEEGGTEIRQTVTPHNPHLQPKEEEGDAPTCKRAPLGHSNMRRRRKLWSPQMLPLHAHEEELPELLETA